MTYRNDLEAALQRARKLEQELKSSRQNQEADRARIADLQAQLELANAEIVRARQHVPHLGHHHHYVTSNATTVLVLGILSLVLCGLMGPFAWHYGNVELERIDAGVADPSKRGEVVAGRVCGIIATTLLVVALLTMFAWCAG